MRRAALPLVGGYSGNVTSTPKSFFPRTSHARDIDVSVMPRSMIGGGRQRDAGAIP